jgi:hypothetical protein
MVANKDLEITQPKLQENFKNIMKKKNGTDSKQLIILVKKLLFFLSKWKKRILKFRTNKQKSWSKNETTKTFTVFSQWMRKESGTCWCCCTRAQVQEGQLDCQKKLIIICDLAPQSLKLTHSQPCKFCPGPLEPIYTKCKALLWL